MKGEKVQLNDALHIFSANLDEIKCACIDNIGAVIESENGPLREDMIRLGTENLRRVVKRIVGAQQNKYQPKVGGITSDMIARAKEVPIEEMYDGRLRRGVGLCPFHPDKTPSFSIKHNRYKCFGCDEYGDSIDFYMKIHGVSFIQAVKAMQ